MTDKATIEANIKEWLAWLRGERTRITQTKNMLRRNNSFCCLGVACDKVLKLERDYIYGSYKYLGYSDLLPPKAIKQLGLDTEEGQFTYIDTEDSEEQHNLADLNDDGLTDFSHDPILSKLNLPIKGKATFPIIAQIIAAKPKNLFREDYNIE